MIIDVQKSLRLDTLLVNDCFSVPCQHEGICIPLSSGFQCVCPPGYQGSLCDTEINPCLSSPCLNQGSCSREGTEYFCDCQPGFTGEDCEVRPAADQTLSADPKFYLVRHR